MSSRLNSYGGLEDAKKASSGNEYGLERQLDRFAQGVEGIEKSVEILASVVSGLMKTDKAKDGGQAVLKSDVGPSSAYARKMDEYNDRLAQIKRNLDALTNSLEL